MIITQTTTLENTDETPRPEPIRIIRNCQWVILASEAEMTEAERRAAYCSVFNIYE